METKTEIETKQPSAAPSKPQKQNLIAEIPTTEEPGRSNGVKRPALDGDKDDDTFSGDNLILPPEDLSSTSGSQDCALEDEIVVANQSVTQNSSLLCVTSSSEDEQVASHHPKRKRAADFNDLSEGKMESDLNSEKGITPRNMSPACTHGLGGAEGVNLVVGFIDVSGRLRFRIQQQTCDGEPISSLVYAFPPEPGGSWVTFERVVLADHLVDLERHQVREYVKLRAGSTVTTPQFDSLSGTKTARIIVGFWKGSSEPDPVNKNAVFGVLGRNGAFRVRVARETRDGRLVNGSFPAGAGALWIPWEEVELEPHFRSLSHREIKEYCRIRQHQIDQGETRIERVKNEARAAFEAQQHAARGKTQAGFMHNVSPSLSIISQPEEMVETPKANFEVDPRLRQCLRTENRDVRHSLPDLGFRQSSRTQSGVQKKIDATARLEITRSKTVQVRCDRFTAYQKAAQTTQVPPITQAARAAHLANLAAPPRPLQDMIMVPWQNVNGNGPRTTSSHFHGRGEMGRLGEAWACQEERRSTTGGRETKFHGGIMYERKAHGPFVGKFVSQSVIVSINREDFVEYRVLTKPSFL
ncbi:hypothetical protein CNYM01_13847 [Colletotrichum nymphaeae SA-01]|uniref:Uncharacterized protein n=1 Tax=Colletotrichum nymphaeae SA-01 TaxID=1460502 RepID=A0A135TJ09_9PEZI|nr:hypothetical protein CNYM01_13847 [Colletotrichum nymphaeae SA-01]